MIQGFGGHLFSESFLEQHVTNLHVAIDPSHRRDLQAWRRSCLRLGPASTLRSLIDVGVAPLVRVLGFAGLDQVEISRDVAVASVAGATPPLAALVVPWGEHLGPRWRTALVECQRRGASWCILFNGTHVRLLQAGRAYGARHAEFDIDATLDDQTASAVLWHVLTAPSLQAVVEASDRHRTTVSASLRDGVLAASASLLAALAGRTTLRAPDHAFEQALTVVYRLLFLLFAEARGLAPLWHPVYRESYSVAALRDAAEDPRSSAGLWDAVQAMSRMAHAGCRAGTLRVTAFNGRLFAPSRTPLAERRDLDDEAARTAVLALSTRSASDGTGRERIAYRDLGVEQLGAVYETLLDYEPCVTQGRASPRRNRARRDPGAHLQAGSGLRKASGTFYTPRPLAEFVVRTTLAPLVRDREPEDILNLKVLDPSLGSGAFLVSACRYLAEAYEGALVRSGQCHAADLGPAERSAIRRSVAERCLYGVDLNPMAVQLARLSLWLATLAADKPLSFLDHHLQVGDSLLGAWLSGLRHPPADRRRSRDEGSLLLFDEARVGDALREALPVRFSLAATPDDTAEQVRQKDRALASLSERGTMLSKWKRVADLWCARWFSKTLGTSMYRDLTDAILTGTSALPHAVSSRCLEEAERIGVARRFFHWELEFPEVFFGTDGERLQAAGFDAVIGNPPWDMIRADAGTADARTRSRGTLEGTLRFTRDSGTYAAQSAGHANRYQLFVERSVALTRNGGRVGLVLPSGIVADQGSAPLRRHLFGSCNVDTLVGFENRQRVFPIHRSVRFVLLTATRGATTARIACRLGEADPRSLGAPNDEPASDPWFTMRLTPALLRHLSGDDLAVPDLRQPIDLAIAERAATLFPPLGDERGWAAHFGRELNATDDRRYFESGGRGLPVVEGRHVEPFRTNRSRVRWTITRASARRRLGSRIGRPRLAYRDVASATNRQTLIAAVLPGACVSTHTIFCLRTPLPNESQHFLCGMFNSYVVNYLVRLRVATHVTTAIVERLPIPQDKDGPAAFREIAALAWSLTRGAEDDEAPRRLATLNARVAKLYQLSLEEFDHVLSTFPLVPTEARDLARREFLI